MGQQNVTSQLHSLEPGLPQKASVETAQNWLHEMGFELLTARKGIFIDGHKQPDIVASRVEFLCKMAKIGFLHFTNAPTEGARKALPDDIDAPRLLLIGNQKKSFSSTMRAHFSLMKIKICSGD